MAPLIGFDFAFVEFSREHGQFIVDCTEYYPEGKVRKSSGMPVTAGKAFLYFECPSEQAVLLKLKYSANIAEAAVEKQKQAEIERRFKEKSSILDDLRYYKKNNNSYNHIYQDYVKNIADLSYIKNRKTKTVNYDFETWSETKEEKALYEKYRDLIKQKLDE